MVKSSSCLRLITCGSGDATDKEDHQLVSEIKDSNDKRGWSFRKRSARHRVLSNTVITDTPSSATKETSEYSSINCQSAEEPNVVEKICTTNFSNEKPQLSSVACSEMPETIVAETEGKVDVNLPESDVIIIQAAIRGYLAQRTLLKSKHVVKLQAAVRGHLVRRHAAGTLRCVQAIVKMQLLVRARHAKQSHSDDNLNHSDSKNDYSKTLDNEHHMAKSNVKHTSVEKLLSNKFARQMLESTPKNKPIHVKCDPSKGDSAWKWLERWMTVSAKDSAENKKPIYMSEQSDETKDSTRVSQLETGIPSQVILQLADSKPTVRVSPLRSEDEEKTATYDDNNSNFPASPSTSFIKDNLEEALPKKTITNDAKETSTEIDSFQNEIMESNASVPQEPQIDEQCEQSTKAFASDQLEIDGKKFAGGSRKLSNPAFIAAQSKFEELSSMANSSRPSSLFSQDVSVDSQADTSSVADTAYISKEFVSSENSALYPSKIGDSEYGTVLSISSTLDSPDISEVETLGSEHDAKDLAEGIVNPENTIDHGVLAKTPRATPTSNLAISDSDQLEYVNDSSGNIVDSVMPENSKEPEKNASDLLSEQTENVLQDFKLSLEASPGSHITIPESQGTPSSQVSVKPKENKIKKTGSSSRRRALSVGNKSPANANQDSGSRALVGNKSPANANHDSSSRVSVGNKSPANANHDSGSRVSVGTKSPANANHDSGSRGSREQLPKDQLNGKRRNSFGSVKPDHAEQEPRDNSSNNSSLPRFMQATESARAKLNANSSPRSSPDVHDHDLKKRHSLPGATGRQGSPRVEQSLPQAQHGTKGSGVNAHSERKWQR